MPILCGDRTYLPAKTVRYALTRLKEENLLLRRFYFRVSPRYCASLPGEYIDSTMAFVPALREMGYLARDLMKEEVLFTSFIEKVNPGRHHYD